MEATRTGLGAQYTKNTKPGLRFEEKASNLLTPGAPRTPQELPEDAKMESKSVRIFNLFLAFW